MRQPKKRRRPTKLQAMIHPGDGQSPIECTVVEIAERTALLSVSDADAVPITFVLTFAGGTLMLKSGAATSTTCACDNDNCLRQTEGRIA
jgi:hypothetical protein